MTKINNLGTQTDFEVLQQLFTFSGRSVVDAGCGDGSFAAQLAMLGAQVTGIEPNPVQAAQNRQTTSVDGVTLVEAGAQAMPLDNDSQDIVIFRYSLHHVPADLYPAVFEEVARVLKPGGYLYIIEPIAEGSSHQVMSLFHDETEVRAAAQAAMLSLTTAHFAHLSSNHYEVNNHFAGFDAYFNRYGTVSYNHYHPDQVDNERVRAAFSSFQNKQGEATLVQPIKTDLFCLQA
jgi:ubiquinone/menaquinone biosynthesis C-methylase UbiE